MSPCTLAATSAAAPSGTQFPGDPMQGGALAPGASLGAPCPEGHLPRGLTCVTPECSHLGDLDGSALDSQYLALDQSVGHLLVGSLDDPPERLPRYVHLSGRLLLVHSRRVRETHRLQLVHAQHDLFEGRRGYARWLEHEAAGKTCDSPATSWPWHGSHLLAPRLYYGHMPIISQGVLLRIRQEAEKCAEVRRLSASSGACTEFMGYHTRLRCSDGGFGSAIPGKQEVRLSSSSFALDQNQSCRARSQLPLDPDCPGALPSHRQARPPSTPSTEAPACSASASSAAR